LEANAVMSFSCPGRGVRWLTLTLSAVLASLAGCEASNRYPAELKYTPRSDPLVIKPPDSQPANPDNPGELEKVIARIGKPVQEGGLGGDAKDPAKVPQKQREQLTTTLESIFGKPARPTVKVEDDDQKELVQKLKLDRKTLAQGSIHYRRHCLHCHGLTGDGRGPTGPWLNPHPRDYRQGSFKFVSTADDLNDRKPRRADLLRTLRHGIDGTSMPSFGLESDEVLESLISYVIHLSLRGQVEFTTLQALTQPGNDASELEEESIRTLLGRYLKKWVDSDKVRDPPPYAYSDTERLASIERGYKQFTTKGGAASCIECHVDFGRQVPFRYDIWGTLVRPANLTAGVYRGGRRPVDLYWRIRGGIPPSQMPAAAGLAASGKDDPYWDLVNFVQALPYPNMLPASVRERVYPPASAEKQEQHARAD
jgi:mono/diheme cytochrome c family protein